NTDGEIADDENGLDNVEVVLTSSNGSKRTTHTDPSGAFAFGGLGPGSYRIEVTLPNDEVGTTDIGQDVSIAAGQETPDVAFGLSAPPPEILAAMRGETAEPPPTAEPDASAEENDEQVIALSAVSSLPLRFAEGRDLMAQIGRRVLGDGLVWL